MHVAYKMHSELLEKMSEPGFIELITPIPGKSI